MFKVSIIWSTDSLTKKGFIFLKDSIFLQVQLMNSLKKKFHVCKFKLEFFFFKKFARLKKKWTPWGKPKKTKHSFFEHPKMEQDDQQEDDELR